MPVETLTRQSGGTRRFGRLFTRRHGVRVVLHQDRRVDHQPDVLTHREVVPARHDGRLRRASGPGQSARAARCRHPRPPWMTGPRPQGRPGTLARWTSARPRGRRRCGGQGQLVQDQPLEVEHRDAGVGRVDAGRQDHRPVDVEAQQRGSASTVEPRRPPRAPALRPAASPPAERRSCGKGRWPPHLGRVLTSPRRIMARMEPGRSRCFCARRQHSSLVRAVRASPRLEPVRPRRRGG